MISWKHLDQTVLVVERPRPTTEECEAAFLCGRRILRTNCDSGDAVGQQCDNVLK